MICWAVFTAALLLNRFLLALFAAAGIAIMLIRPPLDIQNAVILAVFVTGSFVHGVIVRLLHATRLPVDERKTLGRCAWMLIFLFATPPVILALDAAMQPGGRLASIADARHSCRRQPSKDPSCSADSPVPARRAAPP